VLFSPQQILSMYRPPYVGTLAAVRGSPSPVVTGTNIAPFLLWHCYDETEKRRKAMLKGFALWLLGVPLVVIILLWLVGAF
jgi:hypothetical protein